MPLDTNVFDKIKTFQDYQRADQDFQMRKQLAAQQLQSGGIDAASKANIYKTQLLSAAAAGGQAAYDKARQTLQQSGIDASEYASDVNTATNQLNTARLAQSPLGSLLNAGAKLTQNDLQAVQTYGSMDNAVKAGYKPEGLALPNMGSYSAPSPNPPPSPSVATSLQPTPQITPKVAPSGNNTQLQATGSNALPNGQPDTAATIYPAPTPAPVPAPTPLPKFNPPTQNPGESIAAYNARAQHEFEVYKLNNSAAIKQGEAKAGSLGKAQGDAVKDATSAGANYDQVVQTIGNIKDLVNSPAGLPQDRYGIPASWKAKASQNFGDTAIGNALGIAPQAQADNENAFNKLNESQTIGAIKELASTGQIRMTRTLENILNRGYLVEPGASDASKKQQADVILGELNNSRIAAQNINASLNGGQQQPYVSPLASSPANVQPAINPSDAVNELRRRGKL